MITLDYNKGDQVICKKVTLMWYSNILIHLYSLNVMVINMHYLQGDHI